MRSTLPASLLSTLSAALLGQCVLIGTALIGASAQFEDGTAETISELSSIGVVDGVITTFNFVQNHIPGAKKEASTIRVAVGINVDAVAHTSGGDAPDVRLYNEEGQELGKNTDSGDISGGSFKDIDVSQKDKQQPTYALLTGHKDAVCIAYLTSTWPDGQPYGWIGSWGRECGVPWYYSGIVLEGKVTDCVWLDKDNSVSDVTAFQVHFPEFNLNAPHHDSKTGTEYYCDNTPVLNFYHNENPKGPFRWVKPKPPAPAKRRSVQPPLNGTSSAVFTNHLTQSNHTAHSATKLCESDSARGPDLISFAEGKFCDMGTRKVLPLCDTVHGKAQECFDTAAQDVRVVKEVAKRSVAVLASRKNYTKIRSWF